MLRRILPLPTLLAAAARIAFARGDQLRALEARTAHLYADIHMHAWMDALPLTAAAMRQVGFFYLVGHGVPEQDFDTLYADMTRFFALDASVESKVHTVTCLLYTSDAADE